MSEFDAFDVLPSINEGIRVDLTLPSGEPSGHHLMVRNYRCDAFNQTLAAINARIAEKGTPDFAQRREDQIAEAASLVSGWSFEAQCTPENVSKFLHKALLVVEQINAVCVDDERFFGKGSTASTSGPKTS